MKQKKSYWRFVNFTKSEKHIKEEKYMLTEEQKRKIERMYNDYYELAYKPDTKEDMKSFFMGKYLGRCWGMGGVLSCVGYKTKSK